MKHPHLTRRSRLLVAATGTLGLIGAAAAAQSPALAAQHAGPLTAHHIVITTGLDNPRSLSMLLNGDFLVAEAGHGANDPANCVGGPEGTVCYGTTGKVTQIHDGQPTQVITGLMSIAGEDGSFATGSDAANRLPGHPYQVVETYEDPSGVPAGLPSGQLGRLLSKDKGGTLSYAGNITAYERAHDPDGEGFDSNPYGVLQLENQTLVADAAGNDILSVRDGVVSLWAKLPGYGKLDAVPTTIVKGPGGGIYVGELHSEVQHKAKVWQYDRAGNVVRFWTGFTDVTGVARGADGSLYVSELFGGTCGTDRMPDCFPGRVVKVAPDGTRTHVNVPVPAGIVVHLGKVYVVAFSISPATGFAGDPALSGQVWQIFP